MWLGGGGDLPKILGKGNQESSNISILTFQKSEGGEARASPSGFYQEERGRVPFPWS